MAILVPRHHHQQGDGDNNDTPEEHAPGFATGFIEQLIKAHRARPQKTHLHHQRHYRYQDAKKQRETAPDALIALHDIIVTKAVHQGVFGDIGDHKTACHQCDNQRP